MIIIVSRVKKALIYIILNLLLDDKEHYDFDSEMLGSDWSILQYF